MKSCLTQMFEVSGIFVVDTGSHFVTLTYVCPLSARIKDVRYYTQLSMLYGFNHPQLL